MTTFRESDAGRAFIASAASRKISPNIMEAIAFHAQTTQEAEDFLKSDARTLLNMLSVWEDVTDGGRHDASGFFWVSDGEDMK